MIDQPDTFIEKQASKEDNSEMFIKELATLINRYSLENGSDTPDFILARHLYNQLIDLNEVIHRRSDWYKPE